MKIDPRCKESFDRQGLMKLLGAQLVEAADGRAAIEVPYREDLTQQHGYFHGGVVTAIADTACGYAAYTTMPSDILGPDRRIQDQPDEPSGRGTPPRRSQGTQVWADACGRRRHCRGDTRRQGNPVRRDARHLYRPSQHQRCRAARPDLNAAPLDAVKPSL